MVDQMDGDYTYIPFRMPPLHASLLNLGSLTSASVVSSLTAVLGKHTRISSLYKPEPERMTRKPTTCNVQDRIFEAHFLSAFNCTKKESKPNG